MPDDEPENEFGTPEPTLSRLEAIVLVVAMALLTALMGVLVYVPRSWSDVPARHASREPIAAARGWAMASPRSVRTRCPRQSSRSHALPCKFHFSHPEANMNYRVPSGPLGLLVLLAGSL